MTDRFNEFERKELTQLTIYRLILDSDTYKALYDKHVAEKGDPTEKAKAIVEKVYR